MKILSRDEILNANDIKTEIVACPEWGGSVYVKGMTAKERDKWEASLFKIEGSGKNTKVTANRDNIRAKFASVSVVDEKGNLIFSAGDIEALSQKSAAAMDRIYSVAQRLSGLSDDDVDELEKNLQSVPDDSSTTN